MKRRGEAMDSEGIPDVLRLSLPASFYTSSDGSPPSQRDPQLRKLVEGIQYSRRLISTYHIIVIGIILVFSTVHWTGKFIRWRKRRAETLRPPVVEEEYNGDVKTLSPLSHLRGIQNDLDFEGSSSSGSSTNGTASPFPQELDEDLNDETPLLRNDRFLRTSPPRRTIFSSIKAFLMYQPRPIPIVTKTLPPNDTSLTILVFIALNFFYMFFHVNFNMFESFVLADRFGLNFVSNLPYLYILAAKNQPLKFLTGRSYESLNLIHRRLGELLCFQAFLHVAGMVVAWYAIIRPNGFGLIRFLLLKVSVYGMIAFFAYDILYFTSLASFRQRWYELFLGLHVVFQVVGLVFVWLHHPRGRIYVGVALAVFLTDRLLYRFALKSTNASARATIMEDDETVKLSAIIPLQQATRWFDFFGSSITAGWKATDHVFVTVPSLGKKHVFQAHPFTISSPAPPSFPQSSESQTEARLELLIRARNNFTADLLMRSRSHNTLPVRFDGPYGSSQARTVLEDSDLALLIAGGSGIAVLWPLVHHLLDISRSSNSDPENGLARTRTRRRIERKRRGGKKEKRMVIIWVIHKGEHIEWLGRRVIQDAENQGVHIIIPRATEEIGRPDLRAKIAEIVSNGDGNEEVGKIGVVASGPDSMGRAVRNQCAGMVRRGIDVDVVVEKFGW